MTGLAPTQDLIMEVLAARHRLGERMWPFSTRVRPALEALARAGLIGYKSGVVERTCNAWLTEAGKREFVRADYVAPDNRYEVLLKGLRKAVRDPETEWIDANIIRLLLDQEKETARAGT